MNSPASGVSIVICCYNSESRLPKTLEHVWNQSFRDSLEIELIVVDNNCSDNTTSIANESYLKSHRKIPLSVVKEPIAGLTSARITGIRNARFETIVLCDDDNWLDNDYCMVAHDILSRFPSVTLAGGCSFAVTEIDPPAWFESISGAWAVGESDYQGFLKGEDAFLRGAGLVIRRSRFLDLLESGFTFLASDRKGNNLSSGGDAEISRAIVIMGDKLYFDRRLRLQHWIASNRLTKEYALRLWEGFGAGTVAQDAERIHAHPEQRIKNNFRKSWLYQLLRGYTSLLIQAKKSPFFYKSDPRPSLSWCSLRGRLKAIAALRSNYKLLINKRLNWLSQKRKRAPQRLEQPQQASSE